MYDIPINKIEIQETLANWFWIHVELLDEKK